VGRAVIARDEKLISRGEFMTHARQGHGGQAGRADVLTNLVRSLAGRLIGWSLAFGHQVGSSSASSPTIRRRLPQPWLLRGGSFSEVETMVTITATSATTFEAAKGFCSDGRW